MMRFRFAAAAALSLALTGAAAAQPAAVTIKVWNFGFGPAPIHLAAGRPVTLTFVNSRVGATISPPSASFDRDRDCRVSAGRGDRARAA